MRRVMADIAADPAAGPVLNDAASLYASGLLENTAGPFLASRDAEDAQRALTEVGALIGALGSRSYDTQVNIDLAEVGTDAVKGVLEKLAGATLDLAKGGLVASVLVEGGKTVLFAIGGDDVARRQAERDLAKTAKGQKEREALQRRLDASLRHLAFVSLLADPSARAALHLKLSPADLPAELPVNRTNPTGGVDNYLDGFESVDEWRDQIFKDGNLVVPDPNADGVAWDAFVAWAQYVNPDLAAAARQMHATMHDAFNTQIDFSQ
ncbi:MAG TPA: hypothetical protein VI854_02930 [Acidimicrobiia bacterium]|nr:hypothetical protein [Acidimicrobiia bacterium]